MWQTEAVTILRTMTGDIAVPPVYSDDRLLTIFVVSASLVINDTSFDNDYSINIGATGISPDPTDSPRDDYFMALTSLKSSCLMARSEARIAAGQAIDIRDGSSSISLRGLFGGKKDVASDLCKAYDDTLTAGAEEFIRNGGGGRSIWGPYNFNSKRSPYGTPDAHPERSDLNFY